MLTVSSGLGLALPSIFDWPKQRKIKKFRSWAIAFMLINSNPVSSNEADFFIRNFWYYVRRCLYKKLRLHHFTHSLNNFTLYYSKKYRYPAYLSSNNLSAICDCSFLFYSLLFQPDLFLKILSPSMLQKRKILLAGIFTVIFPNTLVIVFTAAFM